MAHDLNSSGNGDGTGSGANPDWDRFRGFLMMLVRVQADLRWQSKIDLSGVVQQTLLEAYATTRQMDGWSDGQKAAWLRQALTNNLADEMRKLKTDKRDVRRECSLETELARSVSGLERLLPAPQSTPSQHAVREERMLQVVEALTALPDSQRQVIERHYLCGQTLAEVAEAMKTTRAAVAGLLHRGLKNLRATLEPANE